MTPALPPRPPLLHYIRAPAAAALARVPHRDDKVHEQQRAEEGAEHDASDAAAADAGARRHGYRGLALHQEEREGRL